jgi:acylphosphatase
MLRQAVCCLLVLGLCLLLLLLALLPAMAQPALLAVGFEVFGKVQGVFFRKFTQEQARSLGLRGRVQNTRAGTVTGQLEGERAAVDRMVVWLQKTGSPQSRIDKVELSNRRGIDSFSFQDFRIVR